MSSKRITKAVATITAALLVSTGLAIVPAAAQDSGDYGPPPGGNDQYGPPQGQYAEPPPGSDQGGEYDDQSSQQDEQYAQAYSDWAAQNCVDQANNAATGAVIGGILGAGIGAATSRHAGHGALVGGAIGAGAGAVAGSASGQGGCPPGYVIRGGAPGFAFAGGPYVAWAPAWYHPWVRVGGRWVYHPYRSWYWHHRAYWRPGRHVRERERRR
ncbi:MAG TPA: hypothetical protein VGM17_12630 [Rhizomicrobium sp.]|jgi:hypothetical protein